MNKVILVVCLLALAVSGANTALLLLMATKLKEAGDKAASVARELEQVQQMLKNLADKVRSNLPAKPPRPRNLKGQEAGEASRASDPGFLSVAPPSCDDWREADCGRRAPLAQP
jgi:hypothetical protein